LNGTIQTAGTQTYDDAVVLSGATTLIGTTATFGGGLDGGSNDLTLTFSDLTTLSGGFTNIDDLTSNGSGGTELNGTIQTLGNQTYAGNVTLLGDTTLEGASVVFPNSVAGAGHDLTLNMTALTTVDASFTGIANLSSIGTGGTALNGTVATTGTQLYDNAVTLLGDTTLNGTTVTTNATVAGDGHSLEINGDAVVGGAVSNVSTYTVNGDATLGADVTTTGAQAFNGNVTLAASTVTLNGTTGTFATGIDGANNSLVLTYNGNTTLSGGSFTNLENLTTNGGGTTFLNGTIETAGSQTYDDAVVLSGATTLEGTTASFGGGLNGNGNDLTLTFSDLTTISGGFASLNNLTSDGSGGTQLNGTIETAGVQTYSGNVTLLGDTTLEGAGNDLTLNMTALTTVDASFTGIANLSSIGTGGTALNGTVATSGTQLYDNAVTLLGDTTLDGTTVTTNATVAGGGHALAIEGDAVVGGAVTNVSTYSVNGTAALASDVQTTGTQTYLGGVTLSGDRTLTGSEINTTGTVTGNGDNLVISGNAVVGGAVSNLSTYAVSGTAALAADVTTGGVQTYSAAVTLTGDRTLAGSTVNTTGTVTGDGGSLTIDGGAVVGGTVSNLSAYTVNGTADLGANVSTAGDQTFLGGVTLSENVTLTGATVNTTGTVDGGGKSLTITGNATVGDAVSNLSAYAVSGTADLGADVTTSGNQTYTGPVTLSGGDRTLTGSTVDTKSTVDGGGANLTIQGNASVGGAVSNVSDYAVNGTAGLSANVTTSGDQTYTGLVSLSEDVTLAGDTPTFTTGVAGGNNDLTLDFTGTTAIDGATLTGVANLATGNGGTTELTGTLSTNGTQTYGDNVTLTGPTTLVGTDVSFAENVSGGQDLTINASGTTTFAGPVSIGSLTTDAAGSTQIDGGTVTTTGGQAYGDNVTLGANTTLTGVNVSFGGTVGGGFDLVVNDSGTTSFAAAVTLASVATDAAGTTALDGGSVTTTGAQNFGDAVTLGDDTVLTGANVTLGGTVNGAYALTINDSGDTVLGGVIGAVNALTSITTDGPGTLTLNTSAITTSGNQTYGEVVDLGAATVTLAGDTPSFAQGVDGNGNSLVLTFTGPTAIDGATFTGIADLTSNGTGTTTISGTVETSGSQTYTDDVTLAADTTLASTGNGTISLTGKVDSVIAGGGSLTVNTAGITVISGTVGGTTPLASLTTDAGGSTSLGANVTTTGAISFNDAVNLTAASDLTTVNAAILFGSTVDGGESLDLTAGTGNVSFGGAVGGTTPLDAISVDGAGNLSAANVTAASLVATNVTGQAAFSGAQVYSGAAGLDVSAGSISVTQAVTASGGGVTLDATSGGLTLGSAGDISGDGPVSFTAATAITTGGDVTTSNDSITYGSNTTLSGNVLLNTGSAGGDVAFQGLLDGAKTLGISAGTGAISFDEAVGSTKELAALTFSSAGSVTANGTVALKYVTASRSIGLTVGAGVNNVSIANPGSTITGYFRAGGTGISFAGGSQNSTLSGFTVSGNRLGVNVGSGDYTGTTLADSTVTKNSTNGLQINGAAFTANNVTVTSNTNNGVVLNAGATNATIANSSIGMTAAGVAAGNTFSGLVVNGASGVTVTGSKVGGNLQAGILVQSAANTTISNTVVGLAADGVTAVPNEQSGVIIDKSTGSVLSTVVASHNRQYGVHVKGSSSGTMISGSVFGGNNFDGVYIGDQAAATTISGSRFGLSQTNLALPNFESGLQIATTGSGTVVTTSVFANNLLDGLTVTAAGGGVIGGIAKGDGNVFTRNSQAGLAITGVVGGSPNTLKVANNTVSGGIVGMSLAGVTGLEVISGVFATNSQAGITVTGAFSDTIVKGITVRSNQIGVAVDSATNFQLDGSTAAIRIEGNTQFGVRVTGTSTGTLITGLLVNQGQVGVSLNSETQTSTSGVTVSNNVVINATVAGLSIGLGTVTGSRFIGNTLSGNELGVLLRGEGVILGSETGTSIEDVDANLITASKGAAIKVEGLTAINNTILSNSIYSNGAGIELVDGGNAGVPTPSVTAATLSAGGQVSVTGMLTGAPGETYRIQYFSSLAIDAATAAEVQGRTLLGYQDVTIGGGGTVSIAETLNAFDIRENDWIAATATQLIGGVCEGTSAFSTGVPVTLAITGSSFRSLAAVQAGPTGQTQAAPLPVSPEARLKMWAASAPAARGGFVGPVGPRSVFASLVGRVLGREDRAVVAAPEISGATLTAGRVAITGTLAGAAGDLYRIQYFVRASGPDGTTRGLRLLGSAEVHITENGTATIDKTLPERTAVAGDRIAVTATRLSGSGPNGRSSVLSREMIVAEG